MRPYLRAYSTHLQNVLQRRASLIMDRVGGLALMVSLYYFWSAVIGDKESFLGYTRAQMLSYVLLMNILRSFCLSGRGWELVSEISSGRITSYLIRPVSYQLYSLSLDLAQKTVHLASACIEIAFLAAILGAPLYIPSRPETWAAFAAAVILSSLLFFSLEFLVSSFAFWTAESAGPLFCFELFLQFAAGAFFPLDVLPEGLRSALSATPFPSMVFLPINIFLERLPAGDVARALAGQAAWLAAAALASRLVWNAGVKGYAAEGG